MNLAEELRRIVLPIIESQQAFLVDIQVRGSQTGKVVELFVDADTGMTADRCAAISTEVSKQLDLLDPIRNRYQLIVSSPGTDRPLTLLRQYAKNVGRTIAVNVRNSDAAERIVGELKGIEGNTILLQTSEHAIVSIPFETIVKAIVETKW